MIRTETTYSRDGLIIARDYEKCLSSKCHHASNDAYYGTHFLLQDFQRENMWKPLFACGEKLADGRFKRQFRRAIFGLPSGYGKTEFAAALVLTIATMEVVFGGRYGVVAANLDQVKNIFEKIQTMIALDDDWKEQWKVDANIIRHRETDATIMVLPNKASALESWHFNVLVFDELHVYRNADVWNAGLKGTRVLWNPLCVGITTASDAREGFLWDILQSSANDEGTYVYWLGLDDKDDINKKSAWQKMMVAPWVTWEGIVDQKNSSTTARSFERYIANRFPRTKNAESCFTTAQLDKCNVGKYEFDFSAPYTIGIDGATSGDAYAIVAYQEQDTAAGNTVGVVREWVFDEPDEELGHYNADQISELIATVCGFGMPEVVGIDPNRMMVLNSHLKDTYGIETVSFAQNNATMCQATALVIQKVKERRLKLKGAPKTREHLSHTVKMEREPHGVRFGKDEKRSKIDAAIALGIAMLAYETQVRGHEGMVAVPGVLG